MIPSCVSEIPSSFAEQHIPKDLYPRILEALIFIPQTSPPTLQNAVFKPALAFGAPQTTS